MADIVCEVRGGVLVGVYTDIPDARVIVVDWDDVGSTGQPGIGGGAMKHASLQELPDETRAEYEAALRRPTGVSRRHEG
jgi:hypothetical protein